MGLYAEVQVLSVDPPGIDPDALRGYRCRASLFYDDPEKGLRLLLKDSTTHMTEDTANSQAEYVRQNLREAGLDVHE